MLTFLPASAMASTTTYAKAAAWSQSPTLTSEPPQFACSIEASLTCWLRVYGWFATRFKVLVLCLLSSLHCAIHTWIYTEVEERNPDLSQHT